MDRTPTYIEDWYRTGPDQFNGFSATGDMGDWGPAFMRIQATCLATGSNPAWVDNKVSGRRVFLGRDRLKYGFSAPLKLFGLDVEGISSGVELHFPSGTDGIICHWPAWSNGGGTYINPADPLFSGRGGPSTLRNFNVYGSYGSGSVGIRCWIAPRMHDVGVYFFGWHGIVVQGDVHTPGKSNDNGWLLDSCLAIANGKNPGCDPEWVTVANPTGHRPWGCGLFVQGGDASAGLSTKFYAGSNSGWGIHDNCFLGNQHDMPCNENNAHVVADWEYAIATHPSASLFERQMFNTYGAKPGDLLGCGFKSTNGNSRMLWNNPYCEGAPVVDAPLPAMVINGIGGSDTPQTVRLGPGILKGTWSVPSVDAAGNVHTFQMGSGNGIFRFGCSADFINHPTTGGWYYAMRYKPLVRDVSGSALPTQPFQAGFYRLDHAGADSRVALLLTGDESRAYYGPMHAGRVVFPAGYYDSAYHPVEFGSRTLLPGTGSDHPVGSTYIVVDPVAGGFNGYRLVMSGSVKCWKGFGKIEP